MRVRGIVEDRLSKFTVRTDSSMSTPDDEAKWRVEFDSAGETEIRDGLETHAA
jgi:hypothetical protein